MYLYQVEKRLLGLMVKPYSKQKDFNFCLKELSKYRDGFSLKYFDSIILENTRNTEKYMMVKYNPNIRQRLRTFLKEAVNEGILRKEGKYSFKTEVNGKVLSFVVSNGEFRSSNGIKAEPENRTPYGIYYEFERGDLNV